MVGVATNRLHVDAKSAQQESELACSGNKIRYTGQRGGELDTKLLDFGQKGNTDLRFGR
jgi:hypothetical protein